MDRHLCAVVDIASGPLDPAAALDFVSDPGFGGITMFVGRVRDLNHGRAVTGVSYDMFEPLALNGFREIAARAESDFGPKLKLYIAHAKGRLSVGDLAVVVAGFALGWWAAHWVIRDTKIEDPGLVVWDEYVGVWITLLAAPAGWPWMLAGLVLFRIFDIAKPWPVSWADRKLHGGFGAMLDDALAGLYALAALQLLALLF